jgi:hypothetical protein
MENAMSDESKDQRWKEIVESLRHDNEWLRHRNEMLRGIRSENPTLRDQFAMTALPAIIEKYRCTVPEAAAKCYEFADMMMFQRDKSGEVK